MKRLTDEELATIEAAAVQLTRHQEEDSTNVLLAYELWQIYHRHDTPERHKRVVDIYYKKHTQLR